MTLSLREEAFCLAYVANGFKGTPAAVTAGYAPGSAHVQANRLLNKDKVKARIEELTKPTLEKMGIDAEWVIREMALIASARVGDLLHVTEDGDPYLDFNKMTDAHRAALSAAEIEDFVDRRERDAEGEVVARDVRRVKGKFADKVQALNLLGKHFGLFKDTVKVEAGEGLAEAMMRARKRAQERTRG